MVESDVWQVCALSPAHSASLIRFRKIEIVNDIDDQKRRVIFVRRAAMQISIARGHRALTKISPGFAPSHEIACGKSVSATSAALARGQCLFFFRPPLRDDALLVFLPRPLPLFFPPPVDLFTVAQARALAVLLLVPRFL